MRIIADHVRAAVFVSSEGVYPSNKERGYILRRLIRRAVRYGKMLGTDEPFLTRIAAAVVNNYGKYYPLLSEKKDGIEEIIKDEEEKFSLTLDRGLKEIDKFEKLDGKRAFFLYESYGFPLELTEEIAKDRGQEIDQKVFEKEFSKHRSYQEQPRQECLKADWLMRVKMLQNFTLLHIYFTLL